MSLLMQAFSSVLSTMQRLKRFIRNKYWVTGSALLLWLLFFDRYDFFSQYRTVEELGRLRREKNFYVEEIEKNQRLLSQLQTNPQVLEQYARERFLMKKENEVIFLMMEKQ